MFKSPVPQDQLLPTHSSSMIGRKTVTKFYNQFMSLTSYLNDEEELMKAEGAFPPKKLTDPNANRPFSKYVQERFDWFGRDASLIME